MKLFFKYATIAFGVQIVLLVVLGVVGNVMSPAVAVLFELFLWIYTPLMLLIARFGNFRGESSMIEPVWMGIVAGVILYSIIFGIGAALLKRCQRRNRSA